VEAEPDAASNSTSQIPWAPARKRPGLQEIDFSCVSEDSAIDAADLEEGEADTAAVAPAAKLPDAGTVSDRLSLVNVTVPAALKETVLLAYEPRAISH
jgi:hypothetical protein